MVDCGASFIEPLNMQCILFNTFAGSVDIFIFIALVAIASLGAYFRMLNGTILIMFALFGLAMAQYSTGLYFLTILILGLVVSVWIGNIVKKQ